MDKLNQYRTIIKSKILEHIALAERSQEEEVETMPIFDETHDEYLIRDLGWARRQRVRSTLLHVRLRNGKIWIEEDWTEEGFATDLLQANIPETDIVLGFQPPEMRQYTEFAVA